MNDLEKSIFNTVSWFDIFDYPMTSWEIGKWRWGNISTFEPQTLNIKKILEKSDKLKELISYKEGLYFLKWPTCAGGRDNLIKKRKERYLLAEKKYKKLLKIVNILAHLPFIKLIAVTDGLSYSNSKEEDDIDLLIVTAKKRVWLVRFFSILVLKLFKARPTIVNKKDKICLNFFISETALDLSKIMLPEENGLPDIYFIYWLAWLYPVYDNNVWQKFINANQWLKKYLPNGFFQESVLRRKIILKPVCQIFKKICEKIHGGLFGNLVEKLYCWSQKIVMPKHLKDLANQSTSVIINNEMLKFHDKDKRMIYREKFYEKTRPIN